MNGTRGSKPQGTTQEIQCNQRPPAQHNEAYTLYTVTLKETNMTVTDWGILIYNENGIRLARQNII